MSDKKPPRSPMSGGHEEGLLMTLVTPPSSHLPVGEPDMIGQSILFEPQSVSELRKSMTLKSVDAGTHPVRRHTASTCAQTSTEPLEEPPSAKQETTPITALTVVDEDTSEANNGYQRARMKELQSIVKNCERGFKQDLDNRIEKLEADHVKSMEEKDRSIAQLQTIVGKKEHAMGEMALELKAHEDKTQERLREQKRAFMTVEGDLHAEMARMLKAKEKMRFDLEVVTNQLEVMKGSVGMADGRASDAEQRWFAQQRQLVTNSEAQSRALLEDAYSLVVNQLTDCHETATTTIKTMRKKQAVKLHRLRKKVATSLTSATVSNSAPATDSVVDPPSASDTDDEQFRTLLSTHVDTVKRRDVAALASAEETDANLQSMYKAMVDLSERLDGVDMAANKKLGRLEDRMKSSERSLSIISSKTGRETTKRAAAKASEKMLEDLVSQHEEEMQAVLEENKAYKQQVLEIMNINKITEAEEWKRKYATASLDLEKLQKDHRLQAAKLETALVDARSSERSATESFTALKNKVDELEGIKQQLAKQQEESASVVVKLESKLEAETITRKSAEEQLSQQQEEIEELHSQVKKLEESNSSLREKWVEQRVAETAAKLERISNEPVATPQAVSVQAAAPDTAEVEELRQKMLLLRRDRDTLMRQLDAAMAEISASEERRNHSMERYLKLLSANDAAPRREATIQSKQFEVQQEWKKLKAEERKLEQRSLEVERREAAVQRRVSSYQARGLLDGHSTARKSISSARSVGLESDTDVTSNNRSSAANAAIPVALQMPAGSFGNKLAPLAHRPLTVPPPPSQSHPQRPPASQHPESR